MTMNVIVEDAYTSLERGNMLFPSMKIGNHKCTKKKNDINELSGVNEH